jgi:hypothetical protein
MAVLQVHVVSGASSDEVASRLREHDDTGLLAVMVVDRPGLAAVVIAAGHESIDERAADVMLDEGQALADEHTATDEHTGTDRQAFTPCGPHPVLASRLVRPGFSTGVAGRPKRDHDVSSALRGQ